MMAQIQNLNVLIIVFLLVLISGSSSSSPHPSSLNGISSEIYLFEHQVTKADAKDALKIYNESSFDVTDEHGCMSIPCNPPTKKYCLSNHFINDHCLCEQGHSSEGLPFIPHSCYVSEKTDRPYAGSCFQFNELKKCCCMKANVKRWKNALSSSKAIFESPSSWSFLVMIMIKELLVPVQRIFGIQSTPTFI